MNTTATLEGESQAALCVRTAIHLLQKYAHIGTTEKLDHGSARPYASGKRTTKARAEEVIRLCEEKGWPQHDVCSKLGMSQTTVWKIVARRHRHSINIPKRRAA